MTDEDRKVAEVTLALDGKLGELREALSEKIEDDWFCFCTGSGATGSTSRTFRWAVDFLHETVGAEREWAIYDEEFEKFGKTVHDQEAWRIYCQGTEAEVDALRKRFEKEQFREWCIRRLAELGQHRGVA